MSLDSFGAIIKSALIAGLGAGMVVAAVQFVWTEPIVDRAISIEEQLHAAEHNHAAGAGSTEATEEPPPVVDRPTQKKGLFLGYAIYGVAWGLLFGAAYTIGQNKLPGAGRTGRGLALAAASYWSIGLLPFLKYPANPPGVGDPDTIDFRQHIYLILLVCGILAVGIAVAMRQWATGRRRLKMAIWLPVAWLALASALLYFGLPNNTDAIRTPMPLVNEFRLHSLAGITLFWLVVGCAFGPLLAWTAGLPARVARPAPTAATIRS